MASSFISQTSQLVLLLLQNPKKANPNSLKLSPLHPKHPPYKFKSYKFKSSAITNSSTTNSSTLSSSSSTRTIATLGAMALSLSRLLLNSLQSLSHTAIQHTVQLSTAGRTVFFATISDRPKGYLNTPLTVVAAGMSKWLDIYCGVLMVRVLLSWFPNIPWDRQPLSAIRDLCDPYLNLFRNIIPPVFDTLDVSPLLAFAVLGFLSSILSNSRAPY